ncbi:hypothetical protein [Peribacillus frigoritolerans]|uniref:hypothetical protein n=1 Tax=Peribacillus frigoritolerans TaxID=450367 RepID=UPI00207A7407|nr:hypothetical protein [Peribacillus frigoritolerans]MEE3953480.1 hypothetical protein [Peribacillus frigoritolerans]USK63450.1 hypothetical protein LIT26_19765 [Peribacillus frigoritolerans]
MGFFLVGLVFWTLIGASLLLFIWGLWKKSWKALLISGIALVPPSLYFLGGNSWFRLVALLPLISLLLAFYTRKNIKHSL